MIVFMCLLCNIMSSYGFVLQNTYNFFLKDNDFKIDLIVSPNDLEMISQTQMKEFIIKDKKQFEALEKIARANCKKNVTSNLETTNEPSTPIKVFVVMGKHNNVSTTYIGKLHDTIILKRQIPTKEYDTEYDYVSMVNDYYEQMKEEIRSNNSFRINETDIPEYGALDSLKRVLSLTKYDNCSESVGIGLQAIMCLTNDFVCQKQPTKEVGTRLWSIFQIWFLVYLAVAVPLWCTRGWCCCCLRCKFFKPRQTIEEAKKYIVSYPPGVFKNKNGPVLYEPSERERECYEEFEHFVRTL